MKYLTLKQRVLVPVAIVLTVVIVISVCIRIFPVTKEDVSVKIRNLQVQKIGVLSTYEKDEKISLFNKEVFLDYVINESHAISFKEYKEIYSYNTKYDLYTISFELENHTDKTLGLFCVEDKKNDFLIVHDSLDNEEDVFVNPGETYLICIAVYIDREHFPKPNDVFILEQIDKICFSEIDSTSNFDIFKQDIIGLFVKSHVVLKTTEDVL